MVSLSVVIFLRKRGLREGAWRRHKRRLGPRGNPGRVEHWWPRSINRWGLITDSRRWDKTRTRAIWWGVGLQWGWV